MITVPSDRLAEVFVELADTLVDEFDVVEFLQTLTSRTSELIEGAAAGLLLADHEGLLRFMAASDERVGLLELFQLMADEGPCRDCYHQGTPLINNDLSSAGRLWPGFAPRAVEAGFQSVHAFPLRLRREVIGTLGLFGPAPQPIGDTDARIIQALADVATIGLLQERSIRRREVLAEQLQGALNSRIIIEQAKGAIAQAYGVSVDQAFDLLRRYCRERHLRLAEVARAVALDPAQVPDLTTR